MNWSQNGSHSCVFLFPACVYVFLINIFFLFFLINLFFNWKIIPLQNLVVFHQTSIWISHRYTYPLLFEPPSHLPNHPTPLDWYRAPVWVSWTYSKFPLAIYFMYGNVSFRVTLSIYLNFSSPLPMFIRLKTLCLFFHCCPADKFFSTTFFFFLTSIGRYAYSFETWSEVPKFEAKDFGSPMNRRCYSLGKCFLG